MNEKNEIEKVRSAARKIDSWQHWAEYHGPGRQEYLQEAFEELCEVLREAEDTE